MIDIDSDTVVDNTVIVIRDSHHEIFDKYKEKGYRYGVIHLSDEEYKHNTSFYRDAAFVIRNYWHRDLAKLPSVHFFALGYKRGFWEGSDHAVLPAINRKYIWSFAGQLNKSTRPHMYTALKKIKPHYLFRIKGFNDPNSLSTSDYRNMLLETQIVPCPRGFVNIDSFRTYETLETVGIPLVERGSDNYYDNLFPDHPFIVIDDWKKASGVVKMLSSNPRALQKKQRECQN